MDRPFNRERNYRRKPTLFSETNHKFEAAKTYLLNSITNLSNRSPYSQIIIIAFAKTSSIIYQGNVLNINYIQQIINSLEPNGGNTNLASAFQLVIKFLISTNTPIIRSLDVITDGLANDGENPQITANILLENYGVRFYFYLINNTNEGYRVASKIVRDDDDGKIEIIDSSQNLYDRSQQNEQEEYEKATILAHANENYERQVGNFNFRKQGLERTKFTMIYPDSIIAERWYSMDLLIYVDSLSEKIKSIYRKLMKQRNIIEETEYNDITMTCTNIIPQGSEITVKINSEKINVNPDSISLKWYELYYDFSFRICCSDQQIDYCDIYVDVYVNNLPILSIPLSLRVVNDKNKVTKYAFLDFQWVEQIFASYAPEDEQLVQKLKEQYEVIGINMLTDLKQYHQSFEWGKQELSNRIEQSDLFQLFWSASAQTDKDVETEYQQALNLIENKKKNRNFLTPLYWEEPIPSIPSQLSQFSFYKLRFLATEQIKNYEIERERQQNQVLSNIVKELAAKPQPPTNITVTSMANSNQNNPDIKVEKSNIASVTGTGTINTAIIEQYNYPPEVKQNLAEAAVEIQQLLDQLSIIYSPPSPSNNLKIATETIEIIEKNPSLKSNLINAIKAGCIETLKEILDNPAVNVFIASIEGWNSAE
jgi:hypothetical protein